MLLDTIMDQNFMCQDKLKGWVRQLENEITENPLSKHVSHLYAFTKIVEGYQRQMHKLNLLLEPEKWSESAAGTFFAPEEPVRMLSRPSTFYNKQAVTTAARTPALPYHLHPAAATN